MARGDLCVEHLVAAAEIVHPKDAGERLLLGAEHAPDRHRAFGMDQVAVLPAGLEADALARAVARLAGDRVHRRAFERDGDVDRLRRLALDRADRHRGDEAGGDQRAPQVLDQIGPIGVARVEARDGLDMAGAEQMPSLDDDAAEAARAIGIDRQGEAGAVRGVVDLDIELAEIGEGEAPPAERHLQGLLGLVDLAGIDRIIGVKRESGAERLRLRAGLLDPGKRDCGETIELARMGGERHPHLARRRPAQRSLRPRPPHRNSRGSSAARRADRHPRVRGGRSGRRWPNPCASARGSTVR